VVSQNIVLEKKLTANKYFDLCIKDQTEENKIITDILFLSGEPNTPGHIYRVIRYLKAYENLGAKCIWFPSYHIEKLSLAEINCKVLVIWRTPFSTSVQKIIEKVHEKGATVIFDIDDYMFDPELVDENNIDAIRYLRYSVPGI